MTPLDLLGTAAFFAGLATLIARRWARPAGSPLAAVLAVGGHLAAVLLAMPAFDVLAVTAFAVGLALPAWLVATARRRAAAGHLRAAQRWMGWAATVRPGAPHLRDWQALWRAGQAFYAGDPAPAEALRTQWITTGHVGLLPGLDALTRRWDRLLTSAAVDAQARALCELGQVEAGVEALGRLLPKQLSWVRLRGVRGAALAPLAFAGRVQAVERLGPVLRLTPPVHGLWRATALAAAGRGAEALQVLDAVEGDPQLPPPVRAAAQARRAALPTPTPLGPGAASVAQTLEREIGAAAVMHRRPLLGAWLTLALLGSLAAGFAVLLSQGAPDDWAFGAALVRLGALDTHPGAGAPGWRLLSYGWLHATWTHLGVNALVIGLVGPTVEAGLGRLGGAAVYGLAVLGGGLSIWAFGAAGVTIGASGGALGWLGALGVMAMAHPLTRGTRTARATGRLFLLLLGVQVLFDLTTPQVSAAGHVGGLLTGAAAAWLWLRVLRGGRAPG